MTGPVLASAQHAEHILTSSSIVAFSFDAWRFINRRLFYNKMGSKPIPPHADKMKYINLADIAA